MEQFSDKLNLKELMQTEGRFVGTTSGVSMLPMIKSGRDVVVIEKKTERLKPWDVALYTRGDSYVLHRVISVTDFGYIIRGDNCYSDERINEENVIGVLSSYFKGEKQVFPNDKSYLKYVKNRLRFYKPRKFFVILKCRIKGVLKKIIKGKR